MSTFTKEFLIVIAGLLFFGNTAFSQDNQIPVRDDQPAKKSIVETHHLDIGIGFGLDYGGIFGVQLGMAPIKHLTLFVTGGYYLYELGWNVGLKIPFIAKTSEHAFRPFLKAMYGTNSAITASGTDEYNRIYRGFTVGAGLELRFGKKKGNGFDLDLNVPLRTPEFWEDYQRMANDPKMEVTQGPIPVQVSIGFHHEF